MLLAKLRLRLSESDFTVIAITARIPEDSSGQRKWVSYGVNLMPVISERLTVSFTDRRI